MVENICSEWRISSVYSSLFYILFHDKIGNHRISSNINVLWIYGVNGADFLAFDGHDWIFRCLCLYSKNIRRCKNRLVKIINADYLGLIIKSRPPTPKYSPSFHRLILTFSNILEKSVKIFLN